MNRVLINGTEVTADGVQSFKPDYGLDENSRTYTYGIGSALIVRGDDARELIETFFSDCEGIIRQLPVRVYIDCCDRWFDYTVTYEGMTYCPEDCSVEFTPVRITDATRCFNYLSSTIYWKNGFIDAYDHPQVWYCNQPGAIQKVLYVLAPIIVAILRVIEAIINAVDSICDAIASLFSSDCDIEVPEGLRACNFLNYVNGCGKKVPCPLYREIFEYHAAKCGLVFESSIFQNSVYKNMCLFQLQYERGRVSPVNWISENGANKTIVQLIEDLVRTMNLDYRIFEGKLRIERKDFFDDFKTDLGSVTGLDYCITYKDDNACAYGRFSYGDDALDQEGNRVKDYTDDIIEYNEENADWKRGECITSSPFGRARFMFDGVSAADDDLFFPDYVIDAIRSGNLIAGFFSETAGQLSRYIANNCGADVRRFQDLIIHNDQASLLKALILEEGFDRDDARVIRKVIPGLTILNLDFYWYNYPMSFREFEIDGTTVFEDGLISNFHAIDNPNNPGREIFEISSIDLPITCDLVESINDATVGLVIDTPNGLANVETATIDFENMKVTLSNLEVVCN